MSTDRYFPLFINLNDSQNQRVLYDYYDLAQYYDRGKLPNDCIKAIPAEVIENFVFNSTTILQTKTKLRFFCARNSVLMNSWYGLSEETINLMYELYEGL